MAWSSVANLCSLDVRQPVSVPLSGRGQGTLHGRLGITPIGAIRSVARQHLALTSGQFGLLQFGHPTMLTSIKGEGSRHPRIYRPAFGLTLPCGWA